MNDEDFYPPEEAQRQFDAVLKSMLNTPKVPLKEIVKRGRRKRIVRKFETQQLEALRGVAQAYADWNRQPDDADHDGIIMKYIDSAQDFADALKELQDFRKQFPRNEEQ